MRIRRLKLSGFKSFVEPAELRIEPGLTGIVGPNGCGKSNLLEALRWVMGEASARSLRGGAMDDVIFAGTETRPSRDFAEVSLLAEAEFGDAANDGEIEVVRRIERGAGSAYRINGRDVRAKDVALLFADAATGAHSPALVSQGRIGAVIAAKPVERRQMLEEAAGIAGLHVRRKDAEQKLRATESNLARHEEIIADREQRLGQLKRQAKAAERYRRLTGEIRMAEAVLLYCRWQEADRAADAAGADARAANAEVARTADAHAAAVEARDTATRTLATARADALASRERAQDAAHRLTTLRAERAALDRRIAEIGQLRRDLGDDRGREAGLAQDAAAALRALDEELTTLRTRLDANEQGRPALVRAAAEARDSAHQAELALAQALAEEARQLAQVQIAQAAHRAAEGRTNSLEEDRGRYLRQLDQLADTGEWSAALERAALDLSAAHVDIERLIAAIADAEQGREQAAFRRAEAESDLATARAALAALDAEAKALGTDVRRGDPGNLLAMLEVTAGYETALAAALGIDIDAGLDEQTSHRWAGSAIQTDDPVLPEGTDSLASLVRGPPQLQRRLSQIAVASRDEGQTLRPGQRLVTADGHVRRWDGLIGSPASSAAAQELIRRNRLARLAAERETLVARLQAAAAAHENAMTELRQSGERVETLRRERIVAEQRARTAEQAGDRARSELDRRAREQEAIEERLRDIATAVHAAATDADAARETLAALPDGDSIAADVARLRESSAAARDGAAAADAAMLAHDQIMLSDRTRIDACEQQLREWKSRAQNAVTRIGSIEMRERAIAEELASLAAAPQRIDAEIALLEQDYGHLGSSADAAGAAEQHAEHSLASAQTAVDETMNAQARAREVRARAEAMLEAAGARRGELARISGERFECPPPLLPERCGFEASAIQEVASQSARLERLSQERERIGPVNLVAESELAALAEEQSAAIGERDELREAVARLRGSIGSLNREGRAKLLAAYQAVDAHFQRLFTTLFDGGVAHLALVESDDPLEAGLEIMAQPPGKKLAQLTLLSGGEQALTAVALIFALFLTNPAPVCVLDEVDAPLDDANIERFCDLLDRMVSETRTRYLIVTHNAVTMSRMNRLFGVTMIEKGISRLVSVDLGGAERLLAAE